MRRGFLGKVLPVMLLMMAGHGMAKVKMPTFFGDGMVLQQQATVKLWGSTDKRSQTITVTTSWDGRRYQSKADASGLWTVQVQTPSYGGPYELTVSDGEPLRISNVMIGEVWLCSGQSNMDMRMRGRYGDGVYGALDAIITSDNPHIRMYNAEVHFAGEPATDLKGQWQEASTGTTADFSATAYFFARRLYDVLHIPVGILHLSCGGSKLEAWMSPECVAPYVHLKEVENPSCLYNGMMSAVVGYGIRGCLWYQGEANVDSPDLYTTLFPLFVQDLRNRWGEGEFPFYYAQIAPYNYNNTEGKGANSAYLREAQVKCLDLIPHVGMIVLTDVGQPETIHPMDKQTVGNRFACLALGDTYGRKGIPTSGPLYQSMKVEDGKAILSFTHVGMGLTFYRQPAADFEIAGPDRVFHPAQVAFGKEAQTLIVSSSEVAEPVAVRYAFKDYAKGCLYNMLGLPASSFRTDNW